MKKLFSILLAALLLLTLAACSKAPEADSADGAPGWQTQYDLGVRYLSEGNYEEAILAFEAAIKIDPKNADAYRKLAEAYEKTGDEDAALRTLETGAEATGDRELADLAEKKRQELDAQTEQPEQPEQPEQTEQSEQTEQTEQSEQPEAPDWPSQLSNVVYFGDISNCRMSREASEAYAAALEQLPETKPDSSGMVCTLQAALVDPGDGYPLLMTCYAFQSPYNGSWAAMFDPSAPYQLWTFDGKTAGRYPLEHNAGLNPCIQFGTYAGKPGLHAQDGAALVVGDSQGDVYYTVSEYQIELQHHLMCWGTYVYNGTDPAYMQGETVQDYLDDGWTFIMEDGNYCVLRRLELDGVIIRANDADYEQLNGEFNRIADSFQPNDALKFGGSPMAGILSEPWSSSAAMCAALRGQ